MTVSRSISRTAAATTGAPRSRPKSTGTLAKSPAVIGRANGIIEACERDLKRPLIGAMDRLPVQLSQHSDRGRLSSGEARIRGPLNCRSLLQRANRRPGANPERPCGDIDPVLAPETGRVGLW